jgi:hypothetical protein
MSLMTLTLNMPKNIQTKNKVILQKNSSQLLNNTILKKSTLSV